MALAVMRDDQAIRDAATIVLWRKDAAGEVEVLMGQRGAQAAFMPSKYVFPGGAVDPADADLRFEVPLGTALANGLTRNSNTGPETLVAAAIRELWEETGLALGTPGVWSVPPPADKDHDWAGFAARGLVPTAKGLTFLFRAITPPGRTRRFDARFFLAPAAQVAGNADDFSAASDELSHLHWIAISKTRSLDLPFITEVVLAEVVHRLRHGPAAEGVPFFDNSGPVPTFRRLA
jgi:8-oxo-dGTP pyrophosphatase MutT (NUDIX family)